MQCDTNGEIVTINLVLLSVCRLHTYQYRRGLGLVLHSWPDTNSTRKTISRHRNMAPQSISKRAQSLQTTLRMELSITGTCDASLAPSTSNIRIAVTTGTTHDTVSNDRLTSSTYGEMHAESGAMVKVVPTHPKPNKVSHLLSPQYHHPLAPQHYLICDSATKLTATGTRDERV